MPQEGAAAGSRRGSRRRARTDAHPSEGAAPAYEEGDDDVTMARGGASRDPHARKNEGKLGRARRAAVALEGDVEQEAQAAANAAEAAMEAAEAAVLAEAEARGLELIRSTSSACGYKGVWQSQRQQTADGTVEKRR